MAEFAAGAGHEINNPLATIVGRVQMLLQGEQDPQRRQMLISIGTQAYRIRDMIGDTMLFARPPSPEFADVSLSNIAHQVIEKLARQPEFKGTDIQSQILQEYRVRADETQLSIVISELIKNAKQAGATQIQLSCSGKDSMALIAVTDDGQGFSENERIQAFNPFFSGRQAGRGLGFGLSKCWQIVRQHHGSIKINMSSSQAMSGIRTTVEIEWPLSNSSSMTDAAN